MSSESIRGGLGTEDSGGPPDWFCVLLCRPPLHTDMTTNWSSPSNSSADPESCDISEVFLSTTAFIIVRSVLVVPFSVWVLYLGHQRRRSFKTTSHSDVITLNMAVMHLFECPGLVLCLVGVFLPPLSVVGSCISALSVVGEILLHLLTCVERYLAVVYPLTYLKLKTTRGVLVRNTCIGFIWCFASGWSGLVILYYPKIPFVSFFYFSTVTFAGIFFCSVSVLCVLIRPRPGEVGGAAVDYTKKKAFNTIMVISAAVWLLFFGLFACYVVKIFGLLNDRDWCFLLMFAVWLSLPSSTVVPLLFLYRAEKLTCCRARSERTTPAKLEH